jgi:para-nitrobenzyl esterase
MAVVTMNYRLGIWGFMPVPELDAVNLGLHDQIAALRWIRQAIGAFKGDPQRVTVVGQSAGPQYCRYAGHANRTIAF